MNGEQLQRLEALEVSWDERLGGRDTRPYRELLCYCAGRLMAAGVVLDDLGAYLREASVLALEVLSGIAAGDA